MPCTFSILLNLTQRRHDGMILALLDLEFQRLPCYEASHLASEVTFAGHACASTYCLYLHRHILCTVFIYALYVGFGWLVISIGLKCGNTGYRVLRKKRRVN